MEMLNKGIAMSKNSYNQKQQKKKQQKNKEQNHPLMWPPEKVLHLCSILSQDLQPESDCEKTTKCNLGSFYKSTWLVLLETVKVRKHWEIITDQRRPRRLNAMWHPTLDPGTE